MKPLRRFLDRIESHFAKGGKLEKLYPLYEAGDTFLYTPPDVTKGGTHIRDALDLKRTMITVAIALTPCVLMAIWNTGYQANLVISDMIASGQLNSVNDVAGWRAELMAGLGFGFAPGDLISCLLHGALYFAPVFLVCNIVGGAWEVLFATVRKHEVNEGFLVTGL